MPCRPLALALLIGVASAPAAASDAETFSRADRDRSGGVTEAEFLGVFPFLALEAHRMADADRDGVISRSEFIDATLPVGSGYSARPEPVQGMLAFGPARPAAPFGRRRAAD